MHERQNQHPQFANSYSTINHQARTRAKRPAIEQARAASIADCYLSAHRRASQLRARRHARMQAANAHSSSQQQRSSRAERARATSNQLRNCPAPKPLLQSKQSFWLSEVKSAELLYQLGGVATRCIADDSFSPPFATRMLGVARVQREMVCAPLKGMGPQHVHRPTKKTPLALSSSRLQ